MGLFHGVSKITLRGGVAGCIVGGVAGVLQGWRLHCGEYWWGCCMVIEGVVA